MVIDVLLPRSYYIEDQKLSCIAQSTWSYKASHLLKVDVIISKMKSSLLNVLSFTSTQNGSCFQEKMKVMILTTLYFLKQLRKMEKVLSILLILKNSKRSVLCLLFIFSKDEVSEKSDGEGGLYSQLVLGRAAAS